jgi:hypothetical protein
MSPNATPAANRAKPIKKTVSAIRSLGPDTQMFGSSMTSVPSSPAYRPPNGSKDSRSIKPLLPLSGKGQFAGKGRWHAAATEFARCDCCRVFPPTGLSLRGRPRVGLLPLVDAGPLVSAMEDAKPWRQKRSRNLQWRKWAWSRGGQAAFIPAQNSATRRASRSIGRTSGSSCANAAAGICGSGASTGSCTRAKPP